MTTTCRCICQSCNGTGAVWDRTYDTPLAHGHGHGKRCKLSRQENLWNNAEIQMLPDTDENKDHYQKGFGAYTSFTKGLCIDCNGTGKVPCRDLDGKKKVPKM